MTIPTLKATRWLTTGEGQLALQELRQHLPLQPKRIMKLRTTWGVDIASALSEVCPVLSDAEKKFCSTGVVATSRGLQQSTHVHVARYKANHIPKGSCIVDMCSGIGGDAIAFSERGKLLAVDRDPALCIMAAHNLNQCADNTTSLDAAIISDSAEHLLSRLSSQIADVWLHIDPDRRPAGKRVSDPHFSDPSADAIIEWTRRFLGTVIKLAPAATLPDCWQRAARREWISFSGQCRQQLVWFLPHQDSHKMETKATLVDAQGFAVSFATFEEPTCHDQRTTISHSPEAIIYDFDPAVRASGLSSALANAANLKCLESPAGFFTSEKLPVGNTMLAPDALAGLVASFEVLWRGTFDEKKLRRKIEEFETSSLEIKIRGVPVTPEKLRPRLLGKKKRDESNGGEALTLLVGKNFAAFARRI